MSTTTAAPQPTVTPWGRIGVVVLIVTAIATTLLIAFALPTVKSGPRDLPVAIVGPPAVTEQIAQAFGRAKPGAIELIPASDADAALTMIKDRQAYGAILVGQDGITVETATAASYTVSTTLATLGQQLGVATGAQVTIHDAVPFTDADPRGVGLSAGALPIALGGWIASLGIIMSVRGTTQRLAAALGFAVVGGLTLTTVLYFWIGTFDAHFWAIAAAATLGIGATSFLVLGLEQLLDKVGLVIAALLLVVLGNPLSGLTSAPDLLPHPWGTIGQMLPPGATGTLLRNVAFFDGAAIGAPVAVLASWLAVGLATYAAANVLAGRRVTQG